MAAVGKDHENGSPYSLESRIKDLEVAIQAEAELEESPSDDDIKIHGLSKTLRILLGQTKRQPRPDKVLLSLQILVGLSMLDGNAVRMVKKQVPEVMRHFLMNYKDLEPIMIENVLCLLINFSLFEENHISLATACSESIANILCTEQDVKAISLALRFVSNIIASYEVQRQICDQQAILNFFVLAFNCRNFDENIHNTILQLLLRFGPSTTQLQDGGLSLEELMRMSVLPSKKRMNLCSMQALESFAVGLGIDPYHLDRTALTEALLKCRYPPVPSKVFESQGLVEALLDFLNSGTSESNKNLICHIFANYSVIPDNRLEILYNDGNPPIKRLIQVVGQILYPIAEKVRAHKKGPVDPSTEIQESKAIDLSAHVRVAFSKRFDTVYEAWAYFDKLGDWIVSTAEFESLARTLSLSISESEALKFIDPKNTRFLDPFDFCLAIAWHELPQENTKVVIARLLKEAHVRRRQIMASVSSRSRILSTPPLRAVMPIAKKLAATSKKNSSQKLKSATGSLADKLKSRKSIALDDQAVLQQSEASLSEPDNVLPFQEGPQEAWQRESRKAIMNTFDELKAPVKTRIKMLLTTLINVSNEVACHDVLVLEHLILEIIEPCLFLEQDKFGINESATQLYNKLKYILDDDDLALSEEQQQKVQQSIAKWQNAGLNAIFNTWKHIILLLRVHSIGIPTLYQDTCSELQVPSCAATAGTALKNFLRDPNSISIVACNVGLTAHSAQALSYAIRGVKVSGERLRILNIVQLRDFERMAPLRIIDVSNNNIRDVGFSHLVSAILEIHAEITNLNVAANNLTDLSGNQFALLIGAGHLEDLKLNDNKLGGKGIRSLAVALEENNSVTSLRIIRNVAGTIGGIALGKMLTCNSTLRQLDCSWNEICAESNEQFFKGVTENTSLRILNTSWNTHSKKSINHIGAIIQGSYVEELNLSHIGLDTKEAILIADSLRKVEILHRLNLSGNPIGPGGCRMILRAANEAYPNEGTEPDGLLQVDLENCGAVDSFIFNPAEPAGKYVLDLADPISHSIIHDLLYLASRRKGAFMIGSIKLNDRNCTLLTSESGDGRVTLPEEGIIQFRYVSTQKSATALDVLNKTGFQRFRQALCNTNLGWEDLNEVINIHVGSDTFFSFEMVKELLDIPNLPTETRVHLVVSTFHHVDEPNGGRDLLNCLNPKERSKAENALGHQSIEFCPINPTGFYRLQMSDQVHRSIGLHLQRLTQDQSEYLSRRTQYYEKRFKGGPREELPSVWRNMKLNGNAVTWSSDWSLPVTGTLEFDYVWLLKPRDCDLPMSAETLQQLKKDLAKKPSNERTHHIRKVIEHTFFTTFQLIDLLPLFEGKLARAEFLVMTFSRITDFHGLTHLYNYWISPTERAHVVHRIGVSNLFDEVMAVGYYELNLAHSEERFVMQELLQLACNEPGDNQVDTQYEGCDFQIPIPWIQEVPRKGLVQMFYCRESKVIRKVFSQGAYDHARNPNWAGPHGLSILCPDWLRPFCEADTNQAAGTAWVQTAKLRLIKAKMQDQFGSARECFDSIDRHVDKDAALSRAEWSAGLFSLGIWLHPNETKALFQVLDADGSGTIDLAEFQKFWDTC